MNTSRLFLSLAIGMIALAGHPVQTAAQKVTLTLPRAIELANDSSLAAFRYRNMYIAGYWAYRTYRAGRLPLVTLNVTPVQYSRYITQRYDSQGDVDVYRQQQLFTAGTGLSVRQNVDFTGGTFTLSTGLDYLRNFGAGQATQFTAVPVRVGYAQDLLGYNAFKWDRRIEPLKYEQARRAFLYHREAVAEEAVDYFFNLALAQAECRLAEDNVAASDTLYRIGRRRSQIAAIAQSELLTLELEAVNARNSLKTARIARQRAMFALASFLGMDKQTEIEIVLPGKPLTLFVAADEAQSWAKENNPELLSQRLGVLEAEKNVDYTRKSSRLNSQLSASVGFNQVGETLAAAYAHPLRQDLVALTLSVPLVDWGVRKGRYNVARSELAAAETAERQAALTVEEEVLMTVGDLDIQQELLSSVEDALDLADLAYEQTRQRFMIGKADVNAMAMAIARQQEAQRNYVNALRNCWLSYYKLRKLTLHDFATGFPLSDDSDVLPWKRGDNPTVR